MTVGSVAYAAPEQLTGKALDGRADQYALGLHSISSVSRADRHSPNSNPAVVIGNHLSSPPPRLGQLARSTSVQIDDVLAKAMAKEPYQRFDTCREFAAALTHGGAGLAGPTDDTQLATNIPAPSTPGRVRGASSQQREASPLVVDISPRGTHRRRYRRLVSRGSGRVHRCAPGAAAIRAYRRHRRLSRVQMAASIAVRGAASDSGDHLL